MFNVVPRNMLLINQIICDIVIILNYYLIKMFSFFGLLLVNWKKNPTIACIYMRALHPSYKYIHNNYCSTHYVIGQWYSYMYVRFYLKFIIQKFLKRVHAKTVISMIFQWKQVRYFGFHYDRRNDCYLSNCTQLICRTLSRVWHTLDQR